MVGECSDLGMRAGLASIALLRWSPDGAYLLAGSAGARFWLWETQKWTSQLWSTEVGSDVMPFVGICLFGTTHQTLL